MAKSIVNEINRRIFASRCVGANAPAPSWAKMTKDAQQSFRFLLIVGGFHPIYISQVSRPGYSVETEQHRLLNWHFHYPTNVKWDDVTFTVKEVYSHSNADTFMKKLRGCAWALPDDSDNERLTENDISKEALVNSLGPVKIQSIRPDSTIHEEWTLEGAFIKGVKFSELNYANEDITSAQVTLSYDWAKLKVFSKTDDNTVSVNY
mgnify:CR=1 FL=1|tara:strand:+ start:1153 stop:1770 length:618 start_codon:yes stop_codon:yes gene_type:complete